MGGLLTNSSKNNWDDNYQITIDVTSLCEERSIEMYQKKVSWFHKNPKNYTCSSRMLFSLLTEWPDSF